MNYDKRLAKYARKLDNPKYYEKILDILEKAERNGYEFKMFNEWDLEKISSEICSYYEAVRTVEDDKRMIRYLNKDWFVVSGEREVVFSSPSFFKALGVFLRAEMIMLWRILGDYFWFVNYIREDEKKIGIRLVRGGLNAAKACGISVWEMQKEQVREILAEEVFGG